MKKIGIIILVLGIAFSYSCKKNKKVQTSISGTLITNGTNDPIRLNTELPNPFVILFHVTFSSGGIIAGEDVATEVARTIVDNNANFSFDIDLYEDDEYFLGYSGLDKSNYIDFDQKWKGSENYFPVTAGIYNNINVSCLAHAWVRPRFINTNSDVNNQDNFYYTTGPGPISTDILLTSVNNIQLFFPLNGSIDTLAPWIHKTWSGQTRYGGIDHEVHAKLTRNGVTIDTVIPYNAPPFDTSIVEIRY